jgi:hypothetical protein
MHKQLKTFEKINLNMITTNANTVSTTEGSESRSNYNFLYTPTAYNSKNLNTKYLNADSLQKISFLNMDKERERGREETKRSASILFNPIENENYTKLLHSLEHFSSNVNEQLRRFDKGKEKLEKANINLNDRKKMKKQLKLKENELIVNPLKSRNNQLYDYLTVDNEEEDEEDILRSYCDSDSNNEDMEERYRNYQSRLNTHNVLKGNKVLEINYNYTDKVFQPSSVRMKNLNENKIKYFNNTKYKERNKLA